MHSFKKYTTLGVISLPRKLSFRAKVAQENKSKIFFLHQEFTVPPNPHPQGGFNATFPQGADYRGHLRKYCLELLYLTFRLWTMQTLITGWGLGALILICRSLKINLKNPMGKKKSVVLQTRSVLAERRCHLPSCF